MHYLSKSLPGEFAIYKITNLVNGKFYLGKCQGGLTHRIAQHSMMARKNTIRPLYSAIRKHGRDNFCVTVLCKVGSAEEAYRVEQSLISRLAPQYNLADGGIGPVGVKWSEERRAKIMAAKALNPSKPWLGRKRPTLTDEIKRGMQRNGTRLPYPAHLSDPAMKRIAHRVYRERYCKPVICNETNQYFQSARFAGSFLGLSPKTVRRSANGIGNRLPLSFRYHEGEKLA